MYLNEINPLLIGAYQLQFTKNEMPKKITSEKTHSSFRLIYITSGKTSIKIKGKTHSLNAGSVIYMPPFTHYRFLSALDEFSIINVFFSVDNFPLSGKLIYDFNKEDLQRINYSFSEEKLNDYIVDFKPELLTAFNFLTAKSEDETTLFIQKSALLFIISTLIKKESSKTLVDSVINYIKNNIDSDLSPDILAEKFSYHKNYLSSLIKKKTALSLNDYILNQKIERAKILILDGNLSLLEISNQLGFYDYSHFFKTFKNQTGISPSDFTK